MPQIRKTPDRQAVMPKPYEELFCPDEFWLAGSCGSFFFGIMPVITVDTFLGIGGGTGRFWGTWLEF